MCHRTAIQAGEPFGFEGVIGHREIIAFLRAEMAAPGHAYLFTGAASVGKATVARDFARLLLCPDHGAHEEACRSCRRVASGNHPDLVSVEPEGRTSLGVDQARGVVSQRSFPRSNRRARVFLFADAGLMTEQAADTLLKTLEEPTAPVIFLLVAESEEDFPPTISSRCRTVHFGRVPDEELTAALVDRGIGAEPARVAAMVAGGRPGLALSLATRPEVPAFVQAWLSLPERVTARPGDGFALAEEMLSTLEPLARGSRRRRGHGRKSGPCQKARHSIFARWRPRDPGFLLCRWRLPPVRWADPKPGCAPSCPHLGSTSEGGCQRSDWSWTPLSISPAICEPHPSWPRYSRPWGAGEPLALGHRRGSSVGRAVHS